MLLFLLYFWLNKCSLDEHTRRSNFKNPTDYRRFASVGDVSVLNGASSCHKLSVRNYRISQIKYKRTEGKDKSIVITLKSRNKWTNQRAVTLNDKNLKMKDTRELMRNIQFCNILPFVWSENDTNYDGLQINVTGHFIRACGLSIR